jgi:hypothetical protein
LLYDYSNRQAKRIVGDKDPKIIEFIPALKNHFKNAFVIHIIRDPRDVIVSRMKADWSKKRNFLQHVFAYKVQMQMGQTNGKMYFQNRYIAVLYEKLLKEPEKTLKNVCDFLEIEYDHKMLEFSKSAKDIIDDSEMQWKKEALGPLLQNNTNKWRNRLTERQILVVENCCKEVFNEETYQKITKKKYKLPDRLIANITSITLSIMCVFYKRWRTKKI